MSLDGQLTELFLEAIRRGVDRELFGVGEDWRPVGAVDTRREVSADRVRAAWCEEQRPLVGRVRWSRQASVDRAEINGPTRSMFPHSLGWWS